METKTETAVAPQANGTAVAHSPLSDATMNALVLNGDLSRLSPAQKVEYYCAFCQRVGLDPATQPFKILRLNGKEVLYCDRGGTAQLNKRHKVSHNITDRRKEDDLYAVTARAHTPDGRETESMGVVSIVGLRGEAFANALMKAETKAKRRATLDLLGLGMLDESEVGSIPGAQTVDAPIPNAKTQRGEEGIEIPQRMQPEPPYSHERTEAQFGGEDRAPESWRADLENGAAQAEDAHFQAAAPEVPQDIQRAQEEVRILVRNCKTKADFQSVVAKLRKLGGVYQDARVTAVFNEAYYAAFPKTTSNAGATSVAATP